MILIWEILKKTLQYGWEEIIYLVIYNIVTLAALLAGPTLLVTGVNSQSALLVVAGIVLLALIPPALFGLFWLTYQISLGNAVKFSTYFDGARQHPKPMAVWGGINLLVMVTLISNVIFYQAMTAAWAGFVGLFFYSLLVVWMVLQLLVLAIYPHLEQPGFRMAFRNAMLLVAVNPFAVLGMAAVAVGGVILGGTVPVLMGLASVSLAALVASVTVKELIAIATKSE